MAITDEELKKVEGKKVSTPDGIGKVTSTGDRYVYVDLDSGKKAAYSQREVTVTEKQK